MPVEAMCTVHPSRSAVPNAFGSVDRPMAWALPLSVRSPGRSGDPETSVMAPPELLVALPPSASTTAVDVTVRFRPASRSAHPAEFDPVVETSTSALTLIAPSASAVTPPPEPVVAFVNCRTAVTAALTAMSAAEHNVTQPPPPVPSV
ncbi:MAG: hypothetical protein E6J68_12275 [Deltaproteobacteria bacterium]|nr:MAG: hypothetical protein E6J68_12275 [Deltaproteobacteria bacterium]